VIASEHVQIGCISYGGIFAKCSHFVSPISIVSEP
jgi:hypothetical protein